MLGVIFGAAAKDIDRAVLEQGPPGDCMGIGVNGIEPVKLATLHTILIGASLDDIDAVVDRCPTSAIDGPEDGPWLFALPKEVTDGLARLDPEQRRTVAAEWAETEEWAIDAEEGEEFAGMFDALCTLALNARAAGLNLYAWISL